MTGSKFSINPEEVAERLRAEGYERVSVESSAVSRSPYRYAYVYLTDAECDSYYAVVSDVREYDDADGYIVGVYTHYEEDAFAIEDVQTLDAVVRVLRRQVDRMLAEAS